MRRTMNFQPGTGYLVVAEFLDVTCSLLILWSGLAIKYASCKPFWNKHVIRLRHLFVYQSERDYSVIASSKSEHAHTPHWSKPYNPRLWRASDLPKWSKDSQSRDEARPSFHFVDIVRWAWLLWQSFSSYVSHRDPIYDPPSPFQRLQPDIFFPQIMVSYHIRSLIMSNSFFALRYRGNNFLSLTATYHMLYAQSHSHTVSLSLVDDLVSDCDLKYPSVAV